MHWTERNTKDYIFRIAVDFIDQLEKNMGDITQDKLATILGKTKGYISQVINHPGNITLNTMVKFARALGMKISIVAYSDGDPENRRGPIDSEIFKICWERQGKPSDFWSIKEADQTAKTANSNAGNIYIYPKAFKDIIISNTATPESLAFQTKETLSVAVK